MPKHKLNYVKKKFSKLEYIDSDVQNQLKNFKEVEINTKDYDKLNLRENGVEYVKIKDKNFLNSIKELSKESFNTKEKASNKVLKIKDKLENNVEKFLFDFLKSKSKNGIKNFSNNFTHIAIVESAIRTSNIKKFNLTNSKTNAAATWFHTDWWEGQSFSSMIISRFNWLDKLSKYCGKCKYTNTKSCEDWGCFWDSKYVELINVWIPFSETTEACPLVFSDMNNTEYSDILPYTYKVHYGKNNEKYYYEVATRLKYNKNQKLYSKEDMKLGEAVVFTSNKTPHTAYYTSKNKITRKSIEFRCILLNFDSEKADDKLDKLFDN